MNIANGARLRHAAAVSRRCVPFAVLFAALLLDPGAAVAQATPPVQPTQPEVHEHVHVPAVALAPTKEASGTSWLPVATPMYGVHQPWRGWDVRLSGAIFGQMLYEPGDRHRTGGFDNFQFSSVNWGMAMLRRGVGNGRFGLRAMLSAEPATMPDCGSVNFLGTGEICDGETTHDRQQPHDLVMELAADYDGPIRSTAWRWQVYAGVAGEPAFGLPGYLHRQSSVDNPLRPITHHWLDATHVTFGVVTFGIHNQRWKIEASAFNGRDADERRFDVDLGGFDSASARFSLLATKNLAIQVSAARLYDPKSAFPGLPESRHTRATVSGTYHRPLASDGIWATTIGYGLSDGPEMVAGAAHDTFSGGAVVESSATLSGRHTLFGRVEMAGVPAHHLHAMTHEGSVLGVGKGQLGYVHHFKKRSGLVPGLGGTVSLSILPSELSFEYSGRVAPSYGVFFSLRPARHAM